MSTVLKSCCLYSSVHLLLEIKGLLLLGNNDDGDDDDDEEREEYMFLLL